MKTVIIIPAYNEEKNIKTIVNSCQVLGYNDIMVVDDGSTDNTARIACEAGATVLSHVINRGVGAATQTGLRAAQLLDADVAVTIDADDQHKPQDIKNLINTLVTKGSDIVIGSRFLNHENSVPVVRRLFNRIANIITFFLAGVMLTDSQSGLKAFSRRALATIRISSNGFEFSSEIIREAQYYHLSIIEVPASVVYTPYSLSKGQNLSTGLTTIFRLIIRTLMK
jgi:UDP-N-acetylglucosamine---dolichyl-phosphate N-acetylglucosaminyltransferase